MSPSQLSARTHILVLIGPLVCMALIYEALGFLVAWFTKRICWVPHRFRYGILCAGAFSNYSDIREYHSNNASRLTALTWNIIATAVIMSITGTLPFNASTDQSLSVAYIAVLVLVLLVGIEIVIWPCLLKRPIS